MINEYSFNKIKYKTRYLTIETAGYCIIQNKKSGSFEVKDYFLFTNSKQDIFKSIPCIEFINIDNSDNYSELMERYLKEMISFIENRLQLFTKLSNMTTDSLFSNTIKILNEKLHYYKNHSIQTI